MFRDSAWGGVCTSCMHRSIPSFQNGFRRNGKQCPVHLENISHAEGQGKTGETDSLGLSRSNRPSGRNKGEKGIEKKLQSFGQDTNPCAIMAYATTLHAIDMLCLHPRKLSPRPSHDAKRRQILLAILACGLVTGPTTSATATTATATPLFA